jgi:hypothetical protein
MSFFCYFSVDKCEKYEIYKNSDFSFVRFLMCFNRFLTPNGEFSALCSPTLGAKEKGGKIINDTKGRKHDLGPSIPGPLETTRNDVTATDYSQLVM